MDQLQKLLMETYGLGEEQARSMADHIRAGSPTPSPQAVESAAALHPPSASWPPLQEAREAANLNQQYMNSPDARILAQGRLSGNIRGVVEGLGTTKPEWFRQFARDLEEGKAQSAIKHGLWSTVVPAPLPPPTTGHFQNSWVSKWKGPE